MKIAVSQFPVSEDISKNLEYILKQTTIAAGKGADAIHFPETALSGYEMETNIENWKKLTGAICKISLHAKDSNIYIIFGTYHQNPAPLKPYDCTYIVSNKGILAGKYIKQRLYKSETERFATQDNYCTCEIKGVKCGFLICYDSNFPELFQQYRALGVKLLFLSYYNAKSSKPRNSMDILMQAQFITRATDNLMYISGSNSSAYYSRMPSAFVRPDGKIKLLSRHQAGILICDYPGEPLGWTYNNKINGN